MRCFESLMKSSIEPNTPTLRDPLPFLLIFYQLLDQHNITVNSLTLCPFPEPNSRVLELYTHSFSSSFIQTVESSPDKIFTRPSNEDHPLAPTWRKLRKNLTSLVDSWTLHPDSRALEHPSLILPCHPWWIPVTRRGSLFLRTNACELSRHQLVRFYLYIVVGNLRLPQTLAKDTNVSLQMKGSVCRAMMQKLTTGFLF